ncbi:hypothetical protein MMC11_007885 [Xylographa trunciseda]|nr:hypothetical protein [Xylographa trunciseda]
MPIEVLGANAGLTARSTIPSEEQAFAAMRAALAAGCNFWNGGEFYGAPNYNSLTLLKKYFDKYPEDVDKVVLNVKGATRVLLELGAKLPTFEIDGSADFVRESVAHCLEMLGGRGRIDMFECARRDPKVSLEQTLGTLAALVDEGKIGGVALSEVSAKTIREAAEITKIVAVYSPLGRGMLTGQIKSLDDIPDKDFRRLFPRFQPENFETNLKLVKKVEQISEKKNCTSAQLALGWLRGLSKRDGMPEIIPIPGATTVARVEENSVEIELSEEEMMGIDSVLASCEVAGDRYHAEGMELLNG